MSAQDKRVVELVQSAVDFGKAAVAGELGNLPAFVGDLVEEASRGAAKSVLDALGFETGHVVIEGGPSAKVGFEVLPPDPT